MNPYYDDYRKYKKLYLDLKNQRGGGFSQDVYQKFNVKNYEAYINKLRALATCQKDYTDINELKADLKNIYTTFVDLGMHDFNRKEELDPLSLPDLLRIRNGICTTIRDNIIPLLEKEKNLANKFIQDFKASVGNIDISPYIEYAKKQNLFGLSVGEIIESYAQDLDRKQRELKSLREALKSRAGPYISSAGQRAQVPALKPPPSLAEVPALKPPPSLAEVPALKPPPSLAQVPALKPPPSLAEVPYMSSAGQRAQDLGMQAQPYAAAAANYVGNLRQKYMQPTQCSAPCMEQQTLFGKRCRCPQTGVFAK